MADDQEKTEEPTSKKIEDARKEGNVPKSQDTAGFVALLVAVIATIAMMGLLVSRMEGMLVHSFRMMGQELTPRTLVNLAITSALESLTVVLPIAVLVAVAGALGHVMQFGLLFTSKPLVPDLKKIDPIKGIKNLFSMKKLVEGIKVTAKVAVAFAVGIYFFWEFTKELTTVALFPLGDQISWLAEKAIIMAVVMLVVFFIFGAVDLAIVRFQYFRQLRMSKQEIKDEYKQTEGNPEIKAKIRRLQHQMSRNRMMADIPKADVVLTNPTHFAVALKYEQGVDPAPLVIAKGADLIALRIKEIAREHGVQVVENPELARELYRLSEVGEAIPEALYQAVAEVLAYVYRASGKL